MRLIIYSILLELSIISLGQSMGKQSLAQLEESPAGSKIIWFIDAIKRGESVSDADVEANFSSKLIDKIGLDKLKGTFLEIQDTDGILFIYEAKRQKMTQYNLKLKGMKSEEWLEMQFFFEDTNPYRILGFTLDSADGPKDAGDPIYPKLN